MEITDIEFTELLGKISDIGIALSAEKDHEQLMEMILINTMDITNADGGTLYMMNEANELAFQIMHNKTLQLHQGGKSNEFIDFYPVRLYDEEGNPNKANVAACVALNAETLNIEDAYQEQDFDFSGTRNFDTKMSYRSQSFLTVPLKDHDHEIIGVLQLINATDPKTNKVRAFSKLDQKLVESLSSQAAVAISNKNLIEDQRNLFDAFIKLVALTIDEKSAHTGEHCLRVPILTNMLAKAVCRVDVGPLKDFSMNDDEIYELDVAAWLHDCGKLTTPEYVLDKGTKLQTLYDRVELLDVRFECLIRDKIIEAMEQQSGKSAQEIQQEPQLKAEIEQLIEQRNFLRQKNIGSENLSEEDMQRIQSIGEMSIDYYDDVELPFLSDEELENLLVSRGTLTNHERQIINNHVSVTIKMLESLPYPKHLKRVPEYAGGHHERMDGTGYPNGLTQDEMSIPARMLAIADVFEALTSKERPYKKAMPLSQALSILGKMKTRNHVDAQLFDVFIHEQVYLEYAEAYLEEEQIDEIDIDALPGYTPLT